MQVHWSTEGLHFSAFNFICFHIIFSYLFIHYFIGLDFLGNNFNINVVIIICIFPPGANFLGELWSCDMVHFNEHVAIG